MLGLDWYRFNKKCAGTIYAELAFVDPVGSAGHVVHYGAFGDMNHRSTIFHARVGLVRNLQKARQDPLRQTCVFASGWICGSHSAFRCVWGMKHRCTIFHARVGLVWIQQKSHRDTLRQTCVFASGGICGARSAFQCVRGVKH
jgi:hypothetical protein